MNSVSNRFPKNAPHLNEAQALAYLDGELPRDERETASLHLEGCWICRALMTDLQKSIEGFLEVRALVLPEESAFAGSRVEQFRQRLSRHAEASEMQAVSLRDQARSWAAGVGHGLRALGARRQAALAVGLVACLLVVMFTDVLNTRVSADAILARAEQYESAHLPAQGQVRRTSVRVERVSSSRKVTKPLGTIEFVRDSAAPQIYLRTQSVSGPSQVAVIATSPAKNSGASRKVWPTLFEADDLQMASYIQSAGWTPDLTADSFRALAAGQAGVSSKASHIGAAYEVRYEFAAGDPSGISRALLEVSASDYAPSAMSVVFGRGEAETEYRFTRTSSSIEPRSEEVARLFPPVTDTHAATSNPRSLPALTKPTPLSYSNSKATVREVAVAAALHKVDACLGEEVYIFPMSDGSLLVQGLVDSAARRDAIRQALRTVGSDVHIEVYTPHDIKTGAELYNPPDQFSIQAASDAGSSNTASMADMSSTQTPLYARLTQHFARPGEAEEDTQKQVSVFSNEVVVTARQTFLHAWALKRLESEFSPTRTSGLPADSLVLIDQIRGDHRRWISTLAQRQSELLSQIADASAPVDPSSPNLAKLDADSLLHMAEAQNDLVRSLFTVAAPGKDANPSLARLIALLHRMGS